MVAPGDVDGEACFSLSCNPDVAPDLMAAIDADPAARSKAVYVAQTNELAPFMFGDAVVPMDAFDIVVDSRTLDHELFGPPKMSISDADYMMGLYASTLVKDGGELQIGIGSLGDALVYALKLRHADNAAYQLLLRELGVSARAADVIAKKGETAPFTEGLFAATEMVVDGFLELLEAGIVKRKVYDHLGLQRLLNDRAIGEEVTPATIDALLASRVIHERLSATDVAMLERFGIFRDDVALDGTMLQLPDGTRIPADCTDAEFRKRLPSDILGPRLRGGAVIHGGFFLGPRSFYAALRDMDPKLRRLINMRPVSRSTSSTGTSSSTGCIDGTPGSSTRACW